MKPEELEPAEAAAPVVADDQPKGSLPPGTVLGDGKIKIVLARVDSRLLHGQVATAWTKSVNPSRIIVVSDAVAKTTCVKIDRTSSSSRSKSQCYSSRKMIEVSKDPRFGNTKALLLFENPEDVLRVVEGGVDIQEVNVGSMAHSSRKSCCK